jgi:tRNA (guanine6-N2)-methyltransferase
MVKDDKSKVIPKLLNIGVTTEPGCEEFLRQEIEQRFKTPCETGENWAILEAEIGKLAEIMYFSQTAKRIVLLIAEGSFTDLDELDNQIKTKLVETNILDLLKEKTTRIVCDRSGNQDFNSMDAEQTIMATLKEVMQQKNMEIKVSLNSPQIIFYLRIVDDRYLFGLDCAGRELSKRQHLVFNNPNAIKGTVGFSALLYGEYKPGQLILDPCSLSGNIAIEAALYESSTPLNFYTKKFTLLDIDEFRGEVEEVLKKADAKIKLPPSKPNIISADSSFNNISAQKKNAKIAGIEKSIAFSRTDIKDLDIKSFDDRIDLVCSRVPEPSNHFSESQSRMIYSQLFKNMKYIIKKKAKIVFIVRNPEILEQEAEKEGYKEEDLKQIWQGQQGYFMVRFVTTEINEYWKEREQD